MDFDLPQSDVVSSPDQLVSGFRLSRAAEKKMTTVSRLVMVTDPRIMLNKRKLPAVKDKSLSEAIALRATERSPFLVSDLIEIARQWLATTRKLNSDSEYPWLLSQVKYIFGFNVQWTSDQQLEDLKIIGDAVAYQPLEVMIYTEQLRSLDGLINDTTTVSENDNLQADAWNGLSTIIKALAGSIIQLAIDDLIVEQRILDNDDILFASQDEQSARGTTSLDRGRIVNRFRFSHQAGDENRLIYAPPSIQARLDEGYDFHSYYGWRFFSIDPLALYALDVSIHSDSLPDEEFRPARQPADPRLNIPVEVVTVDQLDHYLIPILGQYDEAYQDLQLLQKRYANIDYQPLNLPIDIESDDDLIKEALYAELLDRFAFEVIRPVSFTSGPNRIRLNDVDNYLFQPDSAIRSIIFSSSLTSNRDNPSLRANDGAEIVALQMPLIVQSSSGSSISLKKHRDEYGPDLSVWFKQSFARVVNNLYPLLTFRGRWMEEITDPSDFVRARTYMLSHLAFRQLVRKYPYLRTGLLELTVNKDGSITVPLTSNEQLLAYRQALERVYDDESVPSWTVLSFSDLARVAQARWAIHTSEPELKSMAYQVRKDQWLLVVNTSNLMSDDRELNSKETTYRFQQALANFFDPDSGPGNLSTFEYYRRMIPVVDLGTLPLEADKRSIRFVDGQSLLRSAQPRAGRERLLYYVIPDSGHLIDNRSLSRVLTYDRAWAGLYSVGWPSISPCRLESRRECRPTVEFLPGLYSHPPIRYLLDINDRVGQIITQPQLSAETAPYEWLLELSVRYEPGNYSCSGYIKDSDEVRTAKDLATKNKVLQMPLFRIALPRQGVERPRQGIEDQGVERPPTRSSISNRDVERNYDSYGQLSAEEQNLIGEIRTVVSHLWHHGWFLSQWSTAQLYDSDAPRGANGVTGQEKFSCSELNQHYPLDPILKSANLDTKYGQLAIDYLNQEANLVSTNPQELI